MCVCVCVCESLHESSRFARKRFLPAAQCVCGCACVDMCVSMRACVYV